MKKRLCLLLCGFALAVVHAADDPNHDHDSLAKPSRPTGQPSQGEQKGCNVSPSRLADFANGERYDFDSVVTFITHPVCLAMHNQISRAAIAEGVTFQGSGPFRLETYAKQVTKGATGSASQADALLGKTVPLLLSENPTESNKLLPLIGQWSLISPTAARAGLTTLIRQETISADGKMSGLQESLKPAVAADLAVALVRMGTLDPVISSELGASVEEMALTVQADSLARFFRGLAAAATAETSLSPAFNLSATALNRGVQKGKGGFSLDQKARLLTAVFEAIRASIGGSGLLEPGSAELNEALGSLVEGRSLTVTSLRKLWQEAVRVLSLSTTQPALADAIAASLTPQVVFLRPHSRDTLLSAGSNYPPLARAIQQNFALAWVKAWDRMKQNHLSVGNFNRLRTTYFEPLADKILDFPPATVDSVWLEAAQRWGLIHDAQVEKKFPRLFLSQLERREAALKEVAANETPDRRWQALWTDFSVLWTLYRTHLPALNRWVSRHEN